MERYSFSPEELVVIENSPVPLGVFQYLNGKMFTVALSQGFCDTFGYKDLKEAYEVMDADMYRDLHPMDMKRVSEAAIRFEVEDTVFDVVYRIKDGEDYRLIHSCGKHIYPGPDFRIAVVWYADEGPYIRNTDEPGAGPDMTVKVNLPFEGTVREMNYDYMTGLPSMTYFFRLAEEGRDKLAGKGREPVMLYADLNGMRFFNKKYGFAEGTQLIRAFAGLLSEHFGNENCSRFGQDHFAFFTVKDGIEERLEKLFEDCKNINGGKSLPVKVGIYLDSTGRVEASLACDRAKYACDILTGEFKSAYNYFDDAMLASEIHRQYIMDNLDRAIENNWIHAYYQPIIRAANGMVCDEEALARWEDPGRGVLSPADFIPILEDCRLIYKLDLHIVDLIIQKMKKQEELGLYIVPVSVNLSRTDFETCDIVEEIRKRMDEAGIEREKLTIEITESVMGKNFEYMKAQVERFQELGFKVWMDDFGSGYSSLDLLQDIKFDLIKMDMRFMKEFDHGEKSRIILSELIRMAVSLGIDTVTEGVETKEQMEFLREVGCTKLQGYYYSRPSRIEDILDHKVECPDIRFENPEETDYYAAMGRISLYDLSVITKDENSSESLGNYFDTIPMAIIEGDTEGLTIVRCNKSYRRFAEKAFGLIVVGQKVDYQVMRDMSTDVFVNGVINCVETEGRSFIKEDLSNGMTVRSFVRMIGVNPVTGVKSFVLVVLEVSTNKDEQA
ncbi:MAG: EAL domain-containing protein [Lachnospiraceae bacterium]|nr:EAL domain-containing protein [Lachnospiraceae bacterium]